MNITKDQTMDQRCLCFRCLQNYRATNMYRIRRINPYAMEKEPCDWCNRPGYDYELIPQNAMTRDTRTHHLRIR